MNNFQMKSSCCIEKRNPSSPCGLTNVVRATICDSFIEDIVRGPVRRISAPVSSFPLLRLRCCVRECRFLLPAATTDGCARCGSSDLASSASFDVCVSCNACFNWLKFSSSPAVAFFSMKAGRKTKTTRADSIE